MSSHSLYVCMLEAHLIFSKRGTYHLEDNIPLDIFRHESPQDSQIRIDIREGQNLGQACVQNKKWDKYKRGNVRML